MRAFPSSRFPGTLFHRIGVAGLSLIALTSSLFSQQAPPYPQNLTPENLRLLLAPIALYPDALIALILPASTVPSDVVLASRFVASNGDPLQIPNQSWDNSVQSLASYPDVITWMDQNLEWTTSLGQAFIVQPKDVMSAIQQLRVQAETAGNLVTTPQQVIVREKTIIRIVPAEPEYLYVPQYDPEIVYVQPYSQDYGPLLTFGIGFAVGAWLNYDCDWNRQQVYRGDWQPGWDYGRYDRGGNAGYDGGGDTIVNVVNINENTAQVWQPSDRSRQQVERQQQNFNRTANTAQTSSDVSDATMNQGDRNLRNVPKPTRADFGKRSQGNRNTTATDRKSTPPPQTKTETSVALNPTTAPDVAGQQGKPRQNADKTNRNPNGKKADRSQQNTASQTATPGPVPSNSAPNQIGGAPAPSKKEQRAANAAITDRMPQTTQAPVVDSNGRTRAADTQPTPGGKRNNSQRASSPTQADPASEVPRPASPPATKKQDRKNTSTERPNTPAPQRAPENQQQNNQPPPRPRPNTERKEQKSSPAPQQQSQQKDQPQQQRPQQQKPQEQKPKPPQQQEQKPREKQQPQQQKPQQQEKRSAPDKAAQPQKASDDKKSDKKEKKD